MSWQTTVVLNLQSAIEMLKTLKQKSVDYFTKRKFGLFDFLVGFAGGGSSDISSS